MVINILMIIKKRIGGKYAALLGDFALEPSENFEHFFSEFTLLTSSTSNGCSSVIFRSIPTNLYNFEGLFVIKKNKKQRCKLKNSRANTK